MATLRAFAAAPVAGARDHGRRRRSGAGLAEPPAALHRAISPPAARPTSRPACIGEYLSRSLRQQIVVENKSGASGVIGVESGAKSAPDGYTILIAPDFVTSAPHIFKMNFDPMKDLRAGRSSCRASRSCSRCIPRSA